MPSPSEGEPSGAATAPTLRDGRYAIVGSLGRGSQAETLDAVDKRDGRAVAIKRFMVQHAGSWKDVELAQREANVLATLQHPNLPRYIEHFEEAGALYLVMEKVEGRNLAKRDHGFDQARVLRLLSDIDACLQYLHGRAPPIIHRDIKPGNVIQRPDGSFCVVDFGSVRDRLKPEGGSTVVGTFGFMAPEQFQGRALPTTDVFAAGATALTLLTGTEPQDLPHKGLAIDVPAALQGQFDPRLVNALSRMLEPDPERRARSIDSALVAARLDPRAPEPRRAKQQAASTPHKGAKHSEKQGRKAAKRAEARAAQAAAYAERQARKAGKRASRRAERGLSRHQTVLPGVALGVFLLLVFRIAALATWVLFAVALPLVLGILAMFDRRLVRVVGRLRVVGERGIEGLDRAADHIRHRFLGGPKPWLDTTAEEVPASSDHRAERVRVDASIDTEGYEFEPDASDDDRDETSDKTSDKTSRGRRS